jgi:hypothetical protein
MCALVYLISGPSKVHTYLSKWQLPEVRLCLSNQQLHEVCLCLSICQRPRSLPLAVVGSSLGADCAPPDANYQLFYEAAASTSWEVRGVADQRRHAGTHLAWNHPSLRAQRSAPEITRMELVVFGTHNRTRGT